VVISLFVLAAMFLHAEIVSAWHENSSWHGVLKKHMLWQPL
jgi:hypothetical protein